MDQIKEFIFDIKQYILDYLFIYIVVLVLLIGLFFLFNYYENVQ